MINLGNTPAPMSGGLPVVWQQDSSGNVSGYVANIKNTVAPVAGVLTLDCSTGNSFLITVTAAVTSMSLTNPSDGQEITLLWQQDATGHAIVLASNLLGATAPSTTANKTSCQRFTYNAGDTNFYATSAGVTGM